MRLRFLAGLIAICGAFAASKPLLAQSAAKGNWADIRSRQPSGLHLSLVLPKDHFFQGERINATLIFSNGDKSSAYSLELGARGPGAIFHATDQQGHFLVDPLQWEKNWDGSNDSGLIRFVPLGQLTLTLPVNESLRFDRPGVYSLYAESMVIRGKGPGARSIALVSDCAVITIEALTSEEEKQVIAEAWPKINMVNLDFATAGPDSATRDGIDALKYLQTPLARDKLIDVMGHPQLLWYAAWGLEAAPDPSAEAARLLAAVRARRLVLDGGGVNRYAELMGFRLMSGHAPWNLSEKQRERLGLEIRKANKAARKEIIQAMLQAHPDRGPTRAEVLCEAFEEVCSERDLPGDQDPDGGAARAALAEEQLDLPNADVRRLLQYWSSFRGESFLPLVRQEVKARGNNLDALLALTDLRPDEARPLVLAEMLRPDSLFYRGTYAMERLADVPPLPLPPLDDFFRAKLADPNHQDLDRLILLIGCYGSAELFPTMLEVYRSNSAAHLSARVRQGGETQMHLYLYWLRCDPVAAAGDFERGFLAGDVDRWNWFNQKLVFSWTDLALPVVRIALKEGDARSASEAAELLRRHGDNSDIGPVVATLERIRRQKKDDQNYVRGIASDAHAFLSNTRWHLTVDQERRLEALAKDLERP